MKYLFNFLRPGYDDAMARVFNHPSMQDVTIDGILYALSDPIRRGILLRLMDCEGMSCVKACEKLAPSTVSFHYKTLREAGLIRSEKVGVEVRNTARVEELNARFPGLLDAILRHHVSEQPVEA